MKKSIKKSSVGVALSSALLLSQVGTAQAFSFKQGELRGLLIPILPMLSPLVQKMRIMINKALTETGFLKTQVMFLVMLSVVQVP